jgi:hypothetical protein
MPRNWPALKGRDEPCETPQATFRAVQRLVISPLQGLLPQKDELCFETQAWALLARPFRARSIPNQESIRPNAEGLTYTADFWGTTPGTDG